MRQEPQQMVKKQHKCFMIFHHGVDSIHMDISMHRIEIIEIENNLSIYQIDKNGIPTGTNPWPLVNEDYNWSCI